MSEPDASRTVVKTYVPSYQKDEWVEHAVELGMSQSEFVRTMVQAGRADFTVDPYPEVADAANADTDQEAADDADGSEFQDRVYALLREETRSWDELLEAITNDVEDRLDVALQSLQEDNRVVYSGRNGGYEVVEE